MLRKRIELSSEYLYYSRHIKIVNGIQDFGLNSKEVDILVFFITLGGGSFDKERRKELRERYNYSFSVLSNHLRSLLEKGLLYKEGKNYVINKYLVPDSYSEEYSIKILRNEVRQ